MGSGPFYVPVVLLSAILGTIIAVALLLAAAVPQWYMITPAASAFGLQTLCQGTECDTIPWTRIWPAGSTVCRSGGDWKDRELTVEVLLWLTLPINIAAFIFVLLAVLGKHQMDSSKIKGIVAICLCVACAVLGFVALMIYAGTYDSWLNCGDHFCDLMTAGNPNIDCGLGASFIVFCLVVLIYILTAILPLLRLVGVAVNLARPFEVAFCISMVVQFALTIAAGVTNRWLVSGFNNRHLGVFQACEEGEGCEKYSDLFGPQIVCPGGTGDTRDTNTFEDRNNAVGALIILCCIAMICFAVVNWLRQMLVLKERFSQGMRIGLAVGVGVVAFVLFVALIIFAASWNSWLYCGDSFCEVTGQTSTCNLGFAFACAMLALICLALLLTLLIWDLVGCLKNRVVFTEPGEVYANEPHSAGGMYTSSSRTTRTTTYTSTTTSRTVAGSSRSGGGRNDWEYDPNSGYYWSDSRHLYWDKQSNMYCDPDTGSWSKTAAR